MIWCTRRFGITTLAMALTTLFVVPHAGPAQAQGFPTKVVRLIVPYPAGGGIDQIARPLAERLAAKWGQPVIVENRPGAATAIAAEHVARAAPDGYTLLIGEVTTFGINPHIYPKLSYDPLKDFAPITIVCRLAPVIAVNAEVPAKTLPELIDLAKAQGGKLSYGSFGNGSYAHIAMEEFKRRANADMLHVPYRGGAAALTGLVSGETKVSMATITNFLGNEAGGKLRILAATTEKRLERRPDLPTVGETVPGYVIDAWVGIVAPAGTPATVLDKIRDDIAAIAGDAEYRTKNFVERFLEPIVNTRAEAAAMLKQDHERWREMVQRAGVKAD
jgi:tripartite-type tricarboxylate transporter receptor subunit TctC